MPGNDRAFRFDGFAFDPTTGELTGPGGADRLPPKPARLLVLLLERPGELVSREELRDELWPDQHVEIDQALAYTVRQVRAALGDDAGEPRFVETLPRRGYRFVGRLDGEARAGAPARKPVRSPRRPLAPGVAAVGLLLAFLWVWAARDRPAAGPPAPARVALLPLDSPDAGPANDRLTEALLVALTAQPGLDVVGPATTAGYRGTRRPHTEVGRELAVSYVVSGGYRPAGEVLFLQLVRVSDGGHLFARRFAGSEGAVQTELTGAAAAIAAAASEETPALPNG